MGENWHYFVCLSANVVCFAIILCVLPADPVCLPGMNIGANRLPHNQESRFIGLSVLTYLGKLFALLCQNGRVGQKVVFSKVHQVVKPKKTT